LNVEAWPSFFECVEPMIFWAVRELGISGTSLARRFEMSKITFLVF